LQKIFASVIKPRIPSEVSGVQVNFCKNPLCTNYGLAASSLPQKGKNVVRDSYSVVAAGKGFPVLKCHCCGEYPPLKSNLGIHEELERLSDYLTPPVEPSCRNKDCENHTIAITIGKSHYASFGTTKSGSKRYKCKACSKTFAVGQWHTVSLIMT